ncbi:sugar fermentation stimulation protein [Gloeomargarita lithophora Alchichica-D10]|uniref:Sugar fermentation stimulation protein homolog n=1 Tax=Gloeomargarita lithophora Alchichica-D10 TaxID=1188229 RepID=A0A1J0AAD7_9CYAN|nr:DNA/RNA nuclease SfsA [Gloeomargarita lithophora]APB32904.1 sugar fermentation stimulation protein [Gloeomargarita lithophora Alchichica-D10]
MLLYSYPLLLPGQFQKRYKRFFADILLDRGEMVTAHCANTGPMTGVAIPGRPVLVSHHSDPKRKLAYTWELIHLEDTQPTWVNINTSRPNPVIRQLLNIYGLPEVQDYQQITPEVPYGIEGSRVDFCLTGGAQPIYIEVKNTTWVQGKLALFPDTVTTRGQKHLRELMRLVPEFRAILVYFIGREDCTHFAPGDAADPEYGRLLRQAVQVGVEVFPCQFAVNPTGISYARRLPLVLD